MGKAALSCDSPFSLQPTLFLQLCLGSPIAGHLKLSEAGAQAEECRRLWPEAARHCVGELQPSPSLKGFPASSGPDVFLEGGGERGASVWVSSLDVWAAMF